MGIHLIMPMAGAGSRFLKGGYECPKPLVELHGKPFFYWAAKSIRDPALIDSVRFVVLREHIERFGIDKSIRACFPTAELVVLDRVLPGAVLSCMAGVETLPEGEGLLFNDCDHLFCSSALEDFLRGGGRADGALLSFEATAPLYSFLAYGEDGFVARTREKEAISTHAICGAYYFRDKRCFLRAAERYLERCSYSEYFMSGVYNELIAAGGKVLGIPTDLHISFGTPAEYEAARVDPAFPEAL